MKCYEAKKKIYDYIKEELSARDDKQVEKHIHTCSSCEEEYLRIKGIRQLFSAELKEPPRSILRAVKKALKKDRPGLFSLHFLKPAAGFAAVLLIAAGALLINNSVTESRNSEISEFLLDSYNISVSLETDDTNYMYLTDIF